MTPELTALTLSALLQVIQFGLMAVPANLALGPRKTLSPRDGRSMVDDLPVTVARLYRALDNHFQGLILFSIAVMVVTLSDQGTAFTAACSWIYLIARILYVPAYAFGWVPWRSLIWSVGFLATCLMLVAALL